MKETLNPLEDKIGKTLEDRYKKGFSKRNLNCTRNSKNKQMGLYQTKKLLYTAKESEDCWQKFFFLATPDRGLIIRIYKELKQKTKPNDKDPVKKW